MSKTLRSGWPFSQRPMLSINRSVSSRFSSETVDAECGEMITLSIAHSGEARRERLGLEDVKARSAEVSGGEGAGQGPLVDPAPRDTLTTTAPGGSKRQFARPDQVPGPRGQRARQDQGVNRTEDVAKLRVGDVVAERRRCRSCGLAFLPP